MEGRVYGGRHHKLLSRAPTLLKARLMLGQDIQSNLSISRRRGITFSGWLVTMFDHPCFKAFFPSYIICLNLCPLPRLCFFPNHQAKKAILKSAECQPLFLNWHRHCITGSCLWNMAFDFVNHYLLSRGSLSILDSSGSSNRPSGNFGFLSGCLAGSDLPPVLELVLLRELQSSNDSIKQTDMWHKCLIPSSSMAVQNTSEKPSLQKLWSGAQENKLQILV